MHPDVERRLYALEDRKNALIERVRALPLSQQNGEMPKGEMTPVGVLMHMALVEKAHSATLSVHPASELAQHKAHRGFMFNTFTRDRTQGGWRPPLLPMFRPKEVLLLEEAEHEWNIHRREIARHLAGVKDPNAAFIKLPFFLGTLSASDYLTFVEVHTKYHEHFFPKHS